MCVLCVCGRDCAELGHGFAGMISLYVCVVCAVW
jgi:hypothetical protein